METNDLLQSLDRTNKLSESAELIPGTLNLMTAAIVGTLIKERLIDYAGQPGQTIEYLSVVVANALIESLKMVDAVEMERFIEKSRQ